MLKEILEGKMKWQFDARNSGMSGAPTIDAEDNDISITVGWNSVDMEYFANVGNFGENNVEWAAGRDGYGGFEDLMGPQGDYSAVDISDPSLKVVLHALKAEFGVDIKKKDYAPLVMAAAGL